MCENSSRNISDAFVKAAATKVQRGYFTRNRIRRRKSSVPAMLYS